MARINYGYYGLTPLGVVDLWFDERDKKWKPIDECIGENCSYSNYADVRSYKAAKRHLRKHSEIPTGTKFLLSSMYLGFDLIMVKRNEAK